MFLSPRSSLRTFSQPQGLFWKARWMAHDSPSLGRRVSGIIPIHLEPLLNTHSIYYTSRSFFHVGLTAHLRMTSRQPHPRRKSHHPPARSIFQAPSHYLKEETSESSNGASVYDAVRASSANDINAYSSNSIYDLSTMDSRMAANIAMLLPLSPEQTAHSPPLHRQDYCQDHGSSSCSCHVHMLSDNFTPDPPSSKRTLVDRVRQREVGSLNDVSRRSRIPKLSKGISSPANPALPKYPPPVRSPTPPGVPSFGTQEAIGYSALFPVQSSTVDRQPQLRGRTHSNRFSRRFPAQDNGSPSSGERWRRRLGFVATPPSSRQNQQGCTVARAADGTAVLGRFPYRQSGHGMNAGRGLDEHPFHRRTLTMAQCDGVNVDYGATNEDARSNICLENLNQKPFMASGAGSSTRNHEELQNALPPLPNPALPRPPRRPISINTFCNVPTCSSYQTCDGQLQAAELSGEVPGTSLQVHSTTNDSPGCLLTSTQTSMVSNEQRMEVGGEEKSVTWLQQAKSSASSFLCCLPTGNESDAATDSNTCSYDTYTTARSQILDDSTADRPHNRLGKQSSQIKQWCADTWKCFCEVASRNILPVTEPMLA